VVSGIMTSTRHSKRMGASRQKSKKKLKKRIDKLKKICYNMYRKLRKGLQVWNKKNSKKLKKRLDKLSKLCYNKYVNKNKTTKERWYSL
jgi:hypothetical protein